MDAKQKYYATAILNLFAGLVFGYISGFHAAQQPPLNPDHFKIPATESSSYVTPKASECARRTSAPCA